MDHMGRGWGPGTFQKRRRSSGGLTGAQAEQKVSLSPHPREIPERSQLVKLWFPVVFLSHAGAKPVQEPPSHRSRPSLLPQGGGLGVCGESSWRNVASSSGSCGTSSSPGEHPQKLTPLLGLGVQWRGLPGLCCRSPFP